MIRISANCRASVLLLVDVALYVMMTDITGQLNSVLIKLCVTEFCHGGYSVRNFVLASIKSLSWNGQYWLYKSSKIFQKNCQNKNYSSITRDLQSTWTSRYLPFSKLHFCRLEKYWGWIKKQDKPSYTIYKWGKKMYFQ